MEARRESLKELLTATSPASIQRFPFQPRLKRMEAGAACGIILPTSHGRGL